MRDIVGTYGTIDYSEVLATARGFKPLCEHIGHWSRRWRKKAFRKAKHKGQRLPAAKTANSPAIFALLRETLREQFQSLDPECTGQMRLKSFRRLLGHIGIEIKGKAWDALLCLVTDGSHGHVVRYTDATDVLTGSVECMTSGRRKIRMALARFRQENGNLDRIFPYGTASSVSEVVTRLGLAIQPISALEDAVDTGRLSVQQLHRLSANDKHDDRVRNFVGKPSRKVVNVDSDDEGGPSDKFSSYAGLDMEQRLKQLQHSKLLRARRKRAVAESLLQQSNTSQQFIYPRFGHYEFFEFTLTNPFATAETVFVDIVDPQKEGALNLVRETTAWYAFRRTQQRLLNRNFPGQVEQDMFGPNRETQIGPNESIQIPFQFCTTRAPEKFGQESAAIVEHKRVISVVFRSTQRQVELARLDVHVLPQGVVIDRTLRFFPQENDVNRTCLRVLKALSDVPGRTNTKQNLAVLCNSPDVVVEQAGSSAYVEPENFPWGPEHSVKKSPPSTSAYQDVFLRYRTKRFPSVQSFYLVLYRDESRSEVFGVFRVVLHCAQRLGISATLGEEVKMELVCRPSRWPRHGRRRNHEYCELHSSHHDEVHFAPAGEFKIDVLAHASTVLLKFRPQRAWSASSETILATMVNRDLGQVLAMWSLQANVRLPHVTQEFSFHVSCRRMLLRFCLHLSVDGMLLKSSFVVSTLDSFLLLTRMNFCPTAAAAHVKFCRAFADGGVGALSSPPKIRQPMARTPCVCLSQYQSAASSS